MGKYRIVLLVPLALLVACGSPSKNFEISASAADFCEEGTDLESRASGRGEEHFESQKEKLRSRTKIHCAGQRREVVAETTYEEIREPYLGSGITPENHPHIKKVVRETIHISGQDQILLPGCNPAGWSWVRNNNPKKRKCDPAGYTLGGTINIRTSIVHPRNRR